MPQPAEKKTRSYSPWLRLDMEKWKGLLQGLVPVKHPAKSLIFQQQQRIDCLYLVGTGRARATLFDSSGAEHDLFILEQGVCMGEDALLMDDVVHYTAAAITDMTLYHIPIPSFLGALDSDPLLHRHLLDIMAYKQVVLEKSMALHAFRAAPQRVAIMLLNLKEHYGRQQPDGSIRIGIRFTHSDIAGITNASRVTVNKVCLQLKEGGVMDKEHGYYVIRRPEELERLAGAEQAEDNMPAGS